MLTSSCLALCRNGLSTLTQYATFHGSERWLAHLHCNGWSGGLPGQSVSGSCTRSRPSIFKTASRCSRWISWRYPWRLATWACGEYRSVGKVLRSLRTIGLLARSERIHGGSEAWAGQG